MKNISVSLLSAMSDDIVGTAQKSRRKKRGEHMTHDSWHLTHWYYCFGATIRTCQEVQCLSFAWFKQTKNYIKATIHPPCDIQCPKHNKENIDNEKIIFPLKWRSLIYRHMCCFFVLKNGRYMLYICIFFVMPNFNSIKINPNLNISGPVWDFAHRPAVSAPADGNVF